MPVNRWSDQKIKEGLERFYQETGRHPTAREFDHCAYLPSARLIQQRYRGGLPEFRKLFLPNTLTDFTKGNIRSLVAKNSIQRSYEYEERFYNFLIETIPEQLVHEQKRLRPGNIACDFFIYTSEKTGLALDLFYADELFNLINIINIKLKRYIGLPRTQQIYFISVSNPKIVQEKINTWVRNRKIELPENIHVSTEEEFIKTLSQVIALK